MGKQILNRLLKSQILPKLSSRYTPHTTNCDNSMLRLLLADDHRIFIDGLKAMLRDVPDYKVIHEATNGLEVMAAIKEDAPDIAILDITMPKMDGLETTRLIRERHPDVKVLLLSMHDEKGFVREAMEAGTNGYLLKNANREEFLHALQIIGVGRNYYCAEVTEMVMKGALNPEEEKAPHLSLSSREVEVLQLIAQELTTEEIAEKLFLSAHTIKSHRKSLLNKLDVKNTAGLVLFAERNGLLDE